MEGRRARPILVSVAVNAVTITTETTPPATREPLMKKVQAKGSSRSIALPHKMLDLR
jgi:hypothetical protein